MTIQYTLTENDYLQYQLYVASTRGNLKENRRKTWLLFTFVSLLLSFLFYDSGNNIMACYFLLFGLFVFCFLPRSLKAQQKKHYQKFTAEAFKNRFNQPSTLTIADEWVETNDINCECRIKLDGFIRVIETAAAFCLEMRTGGSIIIPKNQLADTEKMRELLKRLCSKLSISYTDDAKWRWN